TSDDTLDVKNNEGTPVYVEIRQPNTLHTASELAQYGQQQLAVYIIVLTADDENNLPAEYINFHHIFVDKNKNAEIIDRLGIMQYPANFIINDAGIVAAKNIWGDKLKQTLDTMIEIGD
ncbi:MAG: hypothetical protein LBV41_05045, partial [Cytophagaceae bacterium]|nr:hypothetical protein [Cytophagaceae bacterium]